MSDQNNQEPTTDNTAPSPTEQAVTENVGNVVNQVTGKDLTEEVQNFVSAGKKLLDSVFSELTTRVESKIKEYISNFTK